MSEEDVQVYQYGFQQRASYHQSVKSSDVISIAYSPFSGDFALLDGAGITHWNKDTQIDKRLLTYPSNKKQLLKQIIFIPKYGIYFALAKDNTLQLLNSMLQCSFVFDADNGTILCMLYDMRRDIIITAGVGGVKMWRYLHHKCDRDSAGTEQFFIQYKRYTVTPSQWITRVQLDDTNDRLLCVAQKEIIILTSDCDYLFTISTSPCLPLTDCCYCAKFKYYITASIDTALKVWSEQGTMLHTFTSHSKAVTSVLMHPQSDLIMVSASLDKSVRLWNLETFEEIYKLQVCEHGIQWVGLTRDNYLYCGTSRDLSVWSINFLAHFFSQTRVPVSKISPVMHCNTKKTPRVVVLGEDSSVRLLSALSGKGISTILPPPDISPLNKILDVSYSRYYGLIFLLIDSLTIWVYTSRTDPASRVDHWEEDVLRLMLHTEDVSGTLGVTCSIQCLTVLHSHVTVEGEEGPVTPTCVNLLVLALLDGRLVFIDPVVKGLKYHAISVHRDPVSIHCREHL
ncbi:WD repeat-containing protein 97-like [Bolinopsis microptera]|uniref:WD repeat-containing protein 97-like n=1 Tax=Bolinopsis microptera TaxID=2820187 RepID=UPI00307A47B1